MIKTIEFWDEFLTTHGYKKTDDLNALVYRADKFKVVVDLSTFYGVIVHICFYSDFLLSRFLFCASAYYPEKKVPELLSFLVAMQNKELLPLHINKSWAAPIIGHLLNEE